MTTARFYYKNPDAPKPNQPMHLGVAVFIEREDGSLLLERRSDCNRWAVIGGALEEDESLLDCVSREVREETGLTTTWITFVGTFSHPSRIVAYPDGNTTRSITLAYQAEVEQYDALKRSEESNALAYVPRDELETLDIVETHRHIVDAYLTGKRGILE